MATPLKKIILRELLWLLGILVAAVPLTLALAGLLRQVATLHAAGHHVMQSAVPDPAHRSGYLWALLYGLMVLGCYAGRLGAFGASRLTAMPASAAAGMGKG